jgi:hypothetical protein
LVARSRRFGEAFSPEGGNSNLLRNTGFYQPFHTAISIKRSSSGITRWRKLSTPVKRDHTDVNMDCEEYVQILRPNFQGKELPENLDSCDRIILNWRLDELQYDSVDWILLAQDTAKWQAVANTLINFRVPKIENFFDQQYLQKFNKAHTIPVFNLVAICVVNISASL